jgi:hypothetical protein
MSKETEDARNSEKCQKRKNAETVRVPTFFMVAGRRLELLTSGL